MPGAVDGSEWLPAYRPLLPRAEALLPYLHRMDASRLYTNGGPLVRSLEARLGQVFRLAPGEVAVASSGTTALQAAILTVAGQARGERSLAVVPGYTFAATAHAAIACGYDVTFADVDPGDWALDPGRLSECADPSRVGLIVPVAPYGRPIDIAGWAAVARSTGIPVVIDAAASFETFARHAVCRQGEVPVVLSLHASKVVSAAEGGAVLWRNSEGISRIASALNFGLTSERVVCGPGLNGKLSEYHAAICLASLDGLEETTAANACLMETYAAEIALSGLDRDDFAFAPMLASNYMLYAASSPAEGDRLIERLQARQIGARRWYGRGLHREPFLSPTAETSLPVTEALAGRLVGIPVFPGMTRSQQGRVVRSIETLVRGGE